MFGVVALDDLKRVVRIGMLFDHYGPLLTERQREAIDLHYLQDWSLQEIAETWATSRQAVHDLLSRASHQLEDYEQRLGLEARARADREAIKTCAGKISQVQAAIGHQDRESQVRVLLAEAAAILADLINEEGFNGG